MDLRLFSAAVIIEERTLSGKINYHFTSNSKVLGIEIAVRHFSINNSIHCTKYCLTKSLKSNSNNIIFIINLLTSYLYTYLSHLGPSSDILNNHSVWFNLIKYDFQNSTQWTVKTELFCAYQLAVLQSISINCCVNFYKLMFQFLQINVCFMFLL